MKEPNKRRTLHSSEPQYIQSRSLFPPGLNHYRPLVWVGVRRGGHRPRTFIRSFEDPHPTPILAGTRALVDAGYPAKLVDKAVNEAEELQPLALRVRNV